MSLKKLFDSGSKMDKFVTLLSIMLFPILIWVILKPSTFNTSTLLGSLAITIVLSPFLLVCYILMRYSDKNMEILMHIDNKKQTSLASKMQKIQSGNLLQIASVARGLFNVKASEAEQGLITEYLLENPKDRNVVRNALLVMVPFFLICSILFLRMEISFPSVLLAAIAFAPGAYLAGWLYHYWSPKTLVTGAWLRINAKLKYAFFFLMILFTIGCFAMAVYVAFVPE